ncbi:MAG: hypothetical protein LDL38_11240 [Flavobacterium piscis]|nr:hypothetical protein [Flavobacterium piscis]
MPGLRAKLRNRDHGINSITSLNIENDTIQISDIKKLDTGDGTAINAETLPYEHTSLTPTIHDKIASIVGGIDLVKDEFIADGVSAVFTLSNILDNTAPFLVFYNGQQMKEGSGNDFGLNIPHTAIIFNFVPVINTPIYVLYQKI